MRNVFAQFHQPENQLTHALASVLSLSPALCRGFVLWMTGIRARERLLVEQQRVPGSKEPLDADARRSLPDAYIHGKGEWCLVIESKVAANLTADQLIRHRAMMKRAFDDVRVVAITAEPAARDLPSWVIHRTWVDVFTWMREHATLAPIWSEHLRDYMRLLESRLLTEGYHMPGPLTTFDGIPFDADHPYSYREAKLLLRQALALVSERKKLKALGVSADVSRRAAITGKQEGVVWDYISLRPRSSAGLFTDWPHLTFGIHDDKTEAMVTIPNNVSPVFRRRLVALGAEGFADLCDTTERELAKRLDHKSQYQPVLVLVQRHYPSRRVSVVDGRLVFDLRTIRGNRRQRIRRQPSWIRSAFDMFAEKNGSNVQIQIGTHIPHTSGYLRGRDAIERLEAMWLGCGPFIQCLLGRRTPIFLRRLAPQD